MEKRPFNFPKQQMLRQKTDHDCSVPVFSALTGIPEGEICRELPLAPKQGITVDGWMEWLRKKGVEPIKRQGCPEDIVPCAHLVGPTNPHALADFHWVYRDAEGDVHDPHPSIAAMPANDPRMRELSAYGMKVLTISLSRQKYAVMLPNKVPTEPPKYIFPFPVCFGWALLRENSHALSFVAAMQAAHFAASAFKSRSFWESPHSLPGRPTQGNSGSTRRQDFHSMILNV